MSTYKFFCEKCKVYQYGIFPLGKCPPVVRCPKPKCRKKMRRLFEAPQFQLRGKGFYSTDNG